MPLRYDGDGKEGIGTGGVGKEGVGNDAGVGKELGVVGYE